MPQTQTKPQTALDLFYQFIDDVESGTLPSCEFVKLAIKRHQNDIKHGHKRGLFFDEQRAAHALNFISLLKHTKGDWKGKPFNMQPFQAFIIGSIFGWMREVEINNELRIIRRFKFAYNEIARKNGKTELAGAIGNYMFVGDGEGASEVYTAATKKPQAMICLKQAVSMMSMLKKDSKSINKLVGISTSRYLANMYILPTESKFEALAADSDKEDGLNPHCGIIDEYHAHPTSELMEVIKTGMGGRLQPLLFIITTAGFNKLSPCFRLRKTMIDILRGFKDDDSTFGIIFTLDNPDKFDEEKEWIKANPNIGKSPYWHYMRDQYTNAINQGGEALVQFKTKNLNIWENTSSTWIQDKLWKSLGHKKQLTDFEGKSAYLGIDLASVSDITALTVLIEDDDTFYTFRKFYLPEETISIRTKEGVAYREWVDKGYITAIPGETFESDYMLEDIDIITKIVNIVNIQIDPWQGLQMSNTLQKKGHATIEHGQGIRDFSFPSKKYESFIKQKKFLHDDNEVMAWMLSNVELYRDNNGNYKPDKKRSTEKIDGVYSDIMALSGWIQDNYSEEKEITPSIYAL